MSLSAGSGVSAGGSMDSGSVDLAAIAVGGKDFSDRLQRYAEAAKAAGDTKAAATVLLRKAQEAQAAADRQTATNKADTAQLAAALEEVEQLKSVLAAKIERVDAIIRS